MNMKEFHMYRSGLANCKAKYKVESAVVGHLKPGLTHLLESTRNVLQQAENVVLREERIDENVNEEISVRIDKCAEDAESCIDLLKCLDEIEISCEVLHNEQLSIFHEASLECAKMSNYRAEGTLLMDSVKNFAIPVREYDTIRNYNGKGSRTFCSRLTRMRSEEIIESCVTALQTKTDLENKRKELMDESADVDAQNSDCLKLSEKMESLRASVAEIEQKDSSLKIEVESCFAEKQECAVKMTSLSSTHVHLGETLAKLREHQTQNVKNKEDLLNWVQKEECRLASLKADQDRTLNDIVLKTSASLKNSEQQWTSSFQSTVAAYENEQSRQNEIEKKIKTMEALISACEDLHKKEAERYEQEEAERLAKKALQEKDRERRLEEEKKAIYEKHFGNTRIQSVPLASSQTQGTAVSKRAPSITPLTNSQRNPAMNRAASTAPLSNSQRNPAMNRVPSTPLASSQKNQALNPSIPLGTPKKKPMKPPVVLGTPQKKPILNSPAILATPQKKPMLKPPVVLGTPQKKPILNSPVPLGTPLKKPLSNPQVLSTPRAASLVKPVAETLIFDEEDESKWSEEEYIPEPQAKKKRR